MSKRLENRARCLKCGFYSCNRCPLLLDADVGAIDKCILNYDAVKNIESNSFEDFVFNNSPVTYLQWVGKNQILELGDKVLTLRGGFESCSGGKILTVIDYDDYEYFLVNENDNHKFCISRYTWYMDAFKLET